MNPNLEFVGKEANRASEVTLSPFETVVAFDPVLPLARVPVPAGQGDDLSKGPYVLAFRNEETWRQAWRTCQEKIDTQCQAGAKLGCSISAAKACARPWWKPSLPFLPSGVDDQFKREECEAREMRGCAVSSQERCSTYARETCDPVYANMRIAAPGAPIDRRFSGEPLRRPRITRHDKKLVQTETKASQTEAPSDSPSPGVDAEESKPRVTTFRGRLVMQHEQWERRVPNWSTSHGTVSPPLQQPFPKEGWVGGLVHPKSPAASPQTEKEKNEGGSIPNKGPICIALDLWQKLQQSVMEQFRS